jgi:hypothetical protein
VSWRGRASLRVGCSSCSSCTWRKGGCICAWSLHGVWITSWESSSHPGAEQLDDLLLAEFVDLVGGESSETVLVESLVLLLHCGHQIMILNINFPILLASA